MKNFIKKNWYFIAIIIILVVWSVFNIIYDIREFFKASLFNVFTIFVTSFFAYVLTGNKEYLHQLILFLKGTINL